MKRYRHLFLLIMFCTLLAKSQPAFMMFTNQLAVVNDIDETTSGNLWLATDSGVVYVDVITQNYTHHQFAKAFNRVKIAGNFIWAGGKTTGLWKYNGSNWTNFTKTNGLASDSVNDFDIGANGHIWVATDKGISEFDGTTFTTHNAFLHKVISSICTFGDTVFAGNKTSAEPIKKYTNGTWQNLPNIPSVGNNTRNLKVSSDGILHTSTVFGTYTFRASGWQLNFNGGYDKLSKNGSATKILNYDNIGTYLQGTWDTLKNPMQFLLSSRNLTSISSYADSSFWCGYTAENTSVLVHYFIQNENNSFKKLTSNSLSAGFSSDGYFFQNSSDLDESTSLTGLGKTIVYAASPQISAWQGSAQNRISTTRGYNNEGLPAMVIGPISTNRNSAAFFKKYNRVWRLTKAEIETHKNNYSNSSYLAPAAILTWPGNGDVQFGEEKYVAPFIDQNYNGIYEPMMGDYPDIRGDEAVYFVYNSAQGFSPFGHQSLNIEFHTMAYVFDSIGTPAHNTLFINQKLIFKNQAFDTVLYGLFTDFDLGNPIDDITGCDSLRRMYYVYNADMNDEGPFGWGQKPPAAGVLALTAPLVGFVEYNNVNGTSLTAEEKQFYKLERKWEDGTPMRVDNPSGFWSQQNGTGYLLNSTAPKTNWQFNDINNWYSPWIGLADKRSLGIFELSNIAAGSEICFDYAFLYAGDSSFVDPSSSINELKFSATWLRDFYSLQHFDCADNTIGEVENPRKSNDFLVYPNPNKGDFFVHDNTSSSATLILINSFGQTIQTHTLDAHSTSKIETSNLAAGIYMCLVFQNEQIIHSEKVIISK